MVLTLLVSIALTGCGLLKSDKQKVQAIVTEAQKQLESQKASLGDTMDIEIEARGTSIAYIYTYKQDIGDIDAMKTALAGQDDTLKQGLKSVLDQLKDIGIEDASLIVEYKANDGTMIYETEIK